MATPLMANIVNFDKHGTLQWSKVYLGLFNEFGSEVTTTPDGGYYIQETHTALEQAQISY